MSGRKILPKLEGAVFLAFQKHYTSTKWMSTCVYLLAWIAYPSQASSGLKSQFLGCKHPRRNSAINSAGLNWVWQRVKEIASLQMLMDSTFSN